MQASGSEREFSALGAILYGATPRLLPGAVPCSETALAALGERISMPMMPGKTALLELLKQEGVRIMFGNPGTTELPLMDAATVVPVASINVLSINRVAALPKQTNFAAVS